MSTTIVTGAAGRLGKVVCARFSESGHKVIGIDRGTEGIEAESAYAADLTDERSVADVIEHVASDHGDIDVLVHTVGMWDGERTVDVSLERWRHVVDVNLTSTFLIFREVLKRLTRRSRVGEARLIAFASGQGADRGAAEQAAYSAAKAGVIRLVESVAAEYRDQGITAHAIAPSMILFEGMEDERGIPVGDLANLCLVLAGEAGGAMSGLTVRAYGSRF